MRKRDNRTERVRNTLTVDLGPLARDSLDQVIEKLNADRRRRLFREADALGTWPKYDRGKAIRLAITILLEQLEDEPSPLRKVLDLLGNRALPG